MSIAVPLDHGDAPCARDRARLTPDRGAEAVAPDNWIVQGPKGNFRFSTPNPRTRIRRTSSISDAFWFSI
jgi:hypothetical protein